MFVFTETASSSWSSKQWSPCSGTTIFLHGQGPRCHSIWYGLQEDFTLQWRWLWSWDHFLHTAFNFHVTDELNTQLGLSEHLLSDIADSIGRKSLIVSKLAMQVHLYTLLFEGVQPDRFDWESSGYFWTAASGTTSVSLPCNLINLHCFSVCTPCIANKSCEIFSWRKFLPILLW